MNKDIFNFLCTTEENYQIKSHLSKTYSQVRKVFINFVYYLSWDSAFVCIELYLFLPDCFSNPLWSYSILVSSPS